MNKRGHTVGMILASSLAIANVRDSTINEIAIVAGIGLGSFLPDLDAEYSYFNSKFPKIAKVYSFINDILPNNPITCHRGALFHSILTLIPFIIFRNNPIMLGIGIGILGHHILDMMTPAGLRWLFPFKLKIHLWK